MKQFSAMWTMSTLYTCQFFSLIGEMLMQPIFPFQADIRDISVFVIGLIMGVYPIFNILANLIMGKYMEQNGRKQLFILGAVFQILGAILSALVIYIEVDQQKLFILLATLGRVIQGLGSSMQITPCYSLVPILFQDSYQEKLGYLELSCGLAIMIGSAFASFFYEIGGYSLPYYVNAGLISISIPLIIFFIPTNQEILEIQKQQNETIQNQVLLSKDDTQQDNIEINKKVSYLHLIKDCRVILTFQVIFIPAIAQNMLNPTYSLYLQKELNISPSYSGYILGASSISYMITCPIISILSQKINRRLVIFISLIMCSYSSIMIGKTQYFGLTNSVIVQIISRALRGFGTPGLFIPTIPEYKEFLANIYPKYNQNHLNDVSSALWQSSFQLGAMFGPILGGYCVSELGFQFSSSLIGWLTILLAFLYFVRFSKYFFQLNKSYLDTIKLINEEEKKLIQKREALDNSYQSLSKR